MQLCGNHGRKGCGQCGEVVNCNSVENMFLLVVNVRRWLDTSLWKKCFHLWSMWGGGWIKLCGKHGTKGCGQCGEVVNCNFVENLFSLVVHVGRWLDKTLWKTW